VAGARTGCPPRCGMCLSSEPAADVRGPHVVWHCVGVFRVGCGRLGRVGSGENRPHGTRRPAVVAAGARRPHVVWHCVGAFRVGRRRPGRAGAGWVGATQKWRHGARRPVAAASACCSHVVWHCVGAFRVGRRRPGRAGAGHVGAGQTAWHGACLSAEPAAGARGSRVVRHGVRHPRVLRRCPDLARVAAIRRHVAGSRTGAAANRVTPPAAMSESPSCAASGCADCDVGDAGAAQQAAAGRSCIRGPEVLYVSRWVLHLGVRLRHANPAMETPPCQPQGVERRRPGQSG
jgi:hypothetical protein